MNDSKRQSTPDVASPAKSLERSWLVQRLRKPFKAAHPVLKDNPFAFGGGLKNGGLSDAAMDLLRDVFAFDYMGAAEFEFGAVPEALNTLAKSDDLTAFTFTVPLADVPPDWRDKGGETPTGEATIYVLAPACHRDEVQERIVGWTREPFPDLKEGLHLTGALRPFHEWDGETVGWLELNNGFLFFTDEEMWRKTCDLFGVKT